MPIQTRTREQPVKYKVFLCDLCGYNVGEVYGLRDDVESLVRSNLVAGFIASVRIWTSGGEVLNRQQTNRTYGICENCLDSLDRWQKGRRGML